MIPSTIVPRLFSVLLAASGLFLALAFASYSPSDLSLLSSEPNTPIHNLGGAVGAWLALLLRGGFGLAAFMLPALCWIWASKLWRGESSAARWISRTIATLCLLTSLGVLLAIGAATGTAQTRLGGVLGYLLVREGFYYWGPTGTALLALLIGGLAWIVVAGDASMVTHMGQIGRWTVQWFGRVPFLSRRMALPEGQALGAAAISARPGRAALADEDEERPERVSTPPPRIVPLAEPKMRSTVVPKPKVLPTPKPRSSAGGFQLPGLELLNDPPPVEQRQLGEDLQVNARILEETLREFGIEARVVNIERGPTVTRYELAPAPGVKIQKIVSLADDVALVMKAASCHIMAPIPGKGLVGVEVPNSKGAAVYLKEVLTSKDFQQTGSPLTLAIGTDVSGHPVVADLRECPHLLIAGATGSGKTVCLNSILTGMLFQSSPDDVKLLMIDPKMVELVQYNQIPHLIAPVVTDAKKAAGALAWAIAEMEQRYQTLSKAGCRNIAAYNHKLPQLRAEKRMLIDEDGSGEGKPFEKMPYIVIVVDELADLMMASGREVEESITRLAQLSRAVGLHVILATQRPSVDVITGLIKANFPARIAFQVASKVDSRTILDGNGADKLLGRGDLMFLKPGTTKPIRAQGCYLSDQEIERVVSHLRQQRAPTYNELLIARQTQPRESMSAEEKDEMYDTAKKLVLETGQASTSLLQRRLRLGYGRAARILDLMEQEGIVGPPQGSRPREVLGDPSEGGK